MALERFSFTATEIAAADVILAKSGRCHVSLWLTDQKASEHTCNCIDNFVAQVPTKFIEYFANGSSACVDSMGTVAQHPSQDGLRTAYVLCIPTLAVYLFSIVHACGA